MPNYLTLPFKKSVLVSRVSAMTAKASEFAAQEGETAKRQALLQKATSSPEDQMLLLSALRSSVDSFFVFIAGEAFGIQHITDTLSDDSDDFQIEMDRPPRFNEAMRQPMVSLVSDFIVRSMLFHWYSAFSSEVASQHASAMPLIQVSIARCFRKVDATPLSGLFAKKVSINRLAVPGNITVGDSVAIPYTISGEHPYPVNDIELAVPLEDSKKCKCRLTDNEIVVSALTDGTVNLTLYSRHNDEINDTIKLYFLPYV